MTLLIAGGGSIKHNENDWRFQIHKETKIGYDMLCESVNYDQEEEEGDLLNSNRIINLMSLITNIDTFLVLKTVNRRVIYRLN